MAVLVQGLPVRPGSWRFHPSIKGWRFFRQSGVLGGWTWRRMWVVQLALVSRWLLLWGQA